MFTLKTEIDGDFVMVTLGLNIHGIEIEMMPEESEYIRNVNVDAGAGVYDSHPGNGSFFISWGPEKIVLNCAKFGGGNAGEMCIQIPSTPELLASLRDVLTKWKAAVAENDFAIS